MSSASRTARACLRVAEAILPASLRPWGHAMRSELTTIEEPRRALEFAIGCLGFALRAAIEIHLRPLLFALQILSTDPDPPTGADPLSKHDSLLHHPRLIVMLCAIGATGLGLAYMQMAGAPIRYLAINGGALALGLIVAGLATLLPRATRPSVGVTVLALGAALLATTLLGVRTGGAARWLAVGGLFIQPSLIILPPLLIGFARTRGPLAFVGALLAALALGLQPDRAMAGTLMAGIATLAVLRRDPATLAAAALGAASFVVTLLRPDALPAMPFVDQILYTSFAVSPLAGAAVIGGALLMLVPAIAGFALDPQHRAAYAVFGATWLTLVVAAALGNYPTPMVGYGGSAILGYLFGFAVLPQRPAPDAASAPGDDLRVPEVPGGDSPRIAYAG